MASLTPSLHLIGDYLCTLLCTVSVAGYFLNSLATIHTRTATAHSQEIEQWLWTSSIKTENCQVPNCFSEQGYELEVACNQHCIFSLAVWTSGAGEGWSGCHPTSGSSHNTWGCKWEYLCWSQV